MHKPLFAALALTFAAPASQVLELRPSFAIHDPRIVVEYHLAHGEASIIVEAESDEVLDRIEILTPGGAKLLELTAGAGQSIPLHGLRVESVGPEIGNLFATCPEGAYEFIGRTRTGRIGAGTAHLSHRLLRPPVLSFPVQGQSNVPVTNLVVNWHASPAAEGYEVQIEQNDTDGLRVRLPPGTSSFAVPDGLLAPATETMLEIIAIAANGNRTAVEVVFTTQ